MFSIDSQTRVVKFFFYNSCDHYATDEQLDQTFQVFSRPSEFFKYSSSHWKNLIESEHVIWFSVWSKAFFFISKIFLYVWDLKASVDFDGLPLVFSCSCLLIENEARGIQSHGKSILDVRSWKVVFVFLSPPPNYL